MEAENDFLSTLEESLEKQREHLDRNDLQDLKETIRLYTSAFSGLYNLILRKGLVAEDPYKYEQKISEIEPPPNDPFLESEKIQKISQRLSLFDSQLDFLNHFYQFSCDFLTLPRIKKLISLLKWIKWDSISESATNINTRVMAEILAKITQGSDQMSVSLVNDSLKRMRDLNKKIIGIIKNLSTYQREKYKLDVRRTIIIQLEISRNDMQLQPEETMQKIKRNFVKIMGNSFPFFAELIREIFTEESEGGEDKKAAVLASLKLKETKKETKKEINYRQLLNEALRNLAGIATPLEQAVKKLEFNSSLVDEKTLTLGDKFRMWIMNLSNRKNSNKIIEIDIFDERLSLSKTVKLNFTSFMEEAIKKIRLLAAINNKVSATYRKLETSSEDTVLNFISKNIEDLYLIVNKLDPINTFFKSEAGKNQRNAIKGVKIEVTSIKNSLVKTNQKRHEYIARMEEIEQMKKLGVF